MLTQTAQLIPLKGALIRGRDVAFGSMDFEALAQAKELSGKSLRIHSGTAEVIPREDPVLDAFRIPVDYELSLAALIKRGRYDWSDSGITEEAFPRTRETAKLTEVRLVPAQLKPGHATAGSEESIDRLSSLSMRPAEARELLALGSLLPMLQTLHPIVALGSVVGEGGNRRIPALTSVGLERGLDLLWFSGALGARHRLLAVPL
jgi:hypothetical protein